MKFVRKLLVIALPLAFVAGCATQENIDKVSSDASRAAVAAEQAAAAASQAAKAAERASAEARAAGDKVDRIFRKGLRK